MRELFHKCRQLGRLLSLMRMGGTGEQSQLHEHVPTELRLGQHASHGVHQHVVRLLDQSIRRRHRFATAGKTAESLIELGGRLRREVRNRGVRHLSAGEPHTFNIDHDDVISAIDVGRVIWLVLAHQDGGDSGRQSPNHLAVAIDDKPFLGAGSSLLYREGKALVVRSFETLDGGRSGSRGSRSGHGRILQKLCSTRHGQPVLDETSSPAGRKGGGK